MAGVIDQLRSVARRFDLIVLLAGGNDVVHFTPFHQLVRDLDDVLILAQQKSTHILFSTTGNIGDVLLFPAPIRWIFARRSRAMHHLFRERMKIVWPAVRFADPYREPDHDPFAMNPRKYFSADLFHPSDAGYAYWFRLISRELDTFDL